MGSRGEHFNVSLRPHSFYAKEYLLGKGIAPSSFLNFALSGNNVEDAVNRKEIISSFNEPLLVLVTSDFHIERTELIFNQIIEEYSKIEVGVKSRQTVGGKTDLSKEEFLTIVEHERKSINSILRNGLYYYLIKRVNTPQIRFYTTFNIKRAHVLLEDKALI